MPREVRRISMARGLEWTPLQAEAIADEHRVLCLDGGRRWGKTWTATECVRRRLHRRHERAARLVRLGRAEPWRGIGLPPRLARHEAPTVSVVVVTPRERHQEQCRTYILGRYAGAARAMLHPTMALIDAGREIWLQYNGVATRIRFVTGSGVAAVVSQAHDIIWVDEAGLLDGAVIEAALPTLWERDGELVLSGTPSLGVEHWYTQRCLSGLDDKHPYYVEDVVERDPECRTIIGTSYQAYLPTVRASARAEAGRMSEAWVRQWIMGDWRVPDLFVFGEWDAKIHVVAYDSATRSLLGQTLPPPSNILGVIDWAYSASTPGAAVVYHVWHRNPLDKSDRVRPLVIAVADHQAALAYTHDGWWQVLEDMRVRHGVQLWYADPSRDEMVLSARRVSSRIGRVRAASKRDKPGRLQLLGSLLHHSDSVDPAMYVARECAHLPRQLAKYRWKQDMHGAPRDVPIDYDDHAIDCTAFLVGEIMRGGRTIPHLVM